MNPKRQTVWLVSMLSLMVVLSAYYLFTTDSSTSMLTSDFSADAVDDGGQDVVVNDQPSSNNDQAVLNEVKNNEDSVEVFDQLVSDRNEQYNQQNDQLLTVISDTSQNKAEAADAIEKLDQLENRSVQIDELEKELSKKYDTVVISPQQNDHYKVVVKSANLDRTQADQLIMTVIQKLDVRPGQVTVQFSP